MYEEKLSLANIPTYIVIYTILFLLQLLVHSSMIHSQAPEERARELKITICVSLSNCNYSGVRLDKYGQLRYIVVARMFYMKPWCVCVCMYVDARCSTLHRTSARARDLKLYFQWKLVQATASIECISINSRNV